MPTRSLPTTWTVTPQGLDVTGGTNCTYQAGYNWTDYTAQVDVQVVANEATWFVHDGAQAGYRLVTAAENDALGQPKNTLRGSLLIAQGIINLPLGQATLPFDLKSGTWHQAEPSSGSTLRTVTN